MEVLLSLLRTANTSKMLLLPLIGLPPVFSHLILETLACLPLHSIDGSMATRERCLTNTDSSA